MTAEEETALRDEQEGPETEERELEEAEKTFAEETGNETRAVSNPKDLPYTIEQNQQILIALGFTPHYHDTDKEGNDETNFGIRVMNMKIGVKFNQEKPAGKVWAYILTEDNKKDFIKNGDLKELPLVQRYLDIQAGKKPIPEITVTGRIIEKRGKGINIEIEEDGEKKEIFFGQGAVKRHDDGRHFIPSGFSKPSKDNPGGKMSIPRDICLPGMDTEIGAEQKGSYTGTGTGDAATAEEQAVVVDRAAAEMQKIREEQGRAPAAGVNQPELPPPEQKLPPIAPKPTVDELVSKYLEILVKVTKALNEEDGIPDREKGFGTKFLFYKVTAAIENGGDHEEQA